MKKKVLLIDNFDSFTYNLLHYLQKLDCEVQVVRNDLLSADFADQYHKIIISPGPGLPHEAGKLLTFIPHCLQNSVLGVCLGQQAIAELFGGTLLPLETVQHGIQKEITHLNNDAIFKDIPQQFKVGLYHSWHTTQLPHKIIPTSFSNDGIVMSFKHEKYDIRAVQFHPESIMTEYGLEILKNWISI